MARQSLLVNQQHSHREVFYFLWLSLKPVIMRETVEKSKRINNHYCSNSKMMNSLFAGHYFVFFFSLLLSNFRLYSSHQTELTRDAESEVEEDEVFVVGMTTEKKKKNSTQSRQCCCMQRTCEMTWDLTFGAGTCDDFPSLLWEDGIGPPLRLSERPLIWSDSAAFKSAANWSCEMLTSPRYM